MTSRSGPGAWTPPCGPPTTTAGSSGNNFEFGDRRPSWRRTGWRRAFYTRPAYEDAQRLLAFVRPDTVLYTNLGQGGPIDVFLQETGYSEWTTPERIIELHRGRGRDELVHRALKDFRAEQSPFQRIQANAALRA